MVRRLMGELELATAPGGTRAIARIWLHSRGEVRTPWLAAAAFSGAILLVRYCRFLRSRPPALLQCRSARVLSSLSPPLEVRMQESRLDAALALSNGDPGPLVAATFGETLEYLVQLQDWLLQAARGLPLSMALATPDGQSPAANRVRRARQAAAI